MEGDLAPSTPSSAPRTVQLATRIARCATQIEEYLHTHNLPSPSFAPNGSAKLPLSPDLEATMADALGAMDELSALWLGPFGQLLAQMGHVYDLVSLHAMQRHQVASKFAVGEEISFAEVAKRCNVDEGIMGRFLQHAVTNYVFLQPRPNYISHSALSQFMRSYQVHDWVGSFCEDMWPAAPKVVDAQAKWQSSQPNHTGHNLAEGTGVPFFQTLSQSPERMRRFANGMSTMQTVPGLEPAVAIDAFDWSSCDEGIVVDIGGSSGTFAIALTAKYPSLRVVVQDLPDVVEQAKQKLELQDSRVTFQPHDFFSPQPVRGADVYFLRMILHDWPDELCVRILRQLIPALKPGAKIMVNDFLVPAMGAVPPYQERRARGHDLAMMALFNSKERSEVEWRELFRAADQRYHVDTVTHVPPSPLAVLVITWDERT